MRRKTRPTSAGLKMLLPSPPKAILPMPIATTPPIRTSHQGSEAGRLKARMTPVRSAEPSSRRQGRCRKKRVMTHSVSIQEATEIAVISRASVLNW